MSNILKNIPNIFELYKKWVSENPQVIGDVETTIKWVSYLVAGRISSSQAVSELIYSLSNLLVLLNDQIIENSRATGPLDKSNEPKLKILLTTLEYCEVFIEYTSLKLGGERGRWIFIVIVQLIKCIGRLILTYYYKEPIIQSPPVQVVDRKPTDKKNSSTVTTEKDEFGNSNSFTFTLKRSGRIIRKVEGSPPVYLRSWKQISQRDFKEPQTPLNKDEVAIRTAEVLYIFKPIIHLTGAGIFGLKSWKSWGLSLLMDLASLRIYYNNRGVLTKNQKVELSRRCVSLLLYLMRSPFYDRFSGNKIESVLNAIANNIPLTKTVCNPLMQYIPFWQGTYFYMWST